MNGKGKIPVEITSNDVDVSLIDIDSLDLNGLQVSMVGNVKKGKSKPQCDIVSSSELVCFFENDSNDWIPVDDGATVQLCGFMMDGTPIFGEDVVCIAN